jgi:uncharacterized protein DUF4235
MQRILYKPVGLALGAAASVVAGVLFKQVWRRTTGEEEAPSATDQDYGWGEIILAAVIQGAIFAGVKAAVDRAGAVGVSRLTGRWPA